MKYSILIPTIFAGLGSLVFALSSSPSATIKRQVINSKDRRKVQGLLIILGKSSEGEFEKFKTGQLAKSALVGLITLIVLLTLEKPFIALLVSPIIALLTYFLIDRDLTKKVKDHQLKIEAEFPAIVEMFSLSMSAGETPLAAMERISNSASGSLSIEFKKVVTQVRNGTPFHLALDAMGREINSNAIRRFVDSLIIATLRGVPIIDVLQRHALEAREIQRNRVLGAAAKAEISMMVPVVFLILPISILFALWPSLSNLNLFSGT